MGLTKVLVAALVALATIADDALAQSTFSGFVRDQSDGETLPSTSISITVDDRDFGTLSNSEGYFAVRDLPPGYYIVTVSHIGYTTYRDTLQLFTGRDLRRDIDLTREVLKLGDVVVEAEAADRVENELSKQPSAVSLQARSLKQMPAMGEPDLLRSLQLLPGVQTASDFSSGLYVRGGGPDQTGIMLDQVRLYNPSHAFGFFSTFNPDAIKDVTFYKGAYPAQYGGNLGGMLDVQNRTGNRHEFNASGGISLISSRVTLEGPLGNGSWMLAGRRTYIDPVLKAVRGASDELNELGYFFYDVNGKVNKKPAPGRRKGAYIFGEKIGSFFLNMEGLGESLTADLWFNRTCVPCDFRGEGTSPPKQDCVRVRSSN